MNHATRTMLLLSSLTYRGCFAGLVPGATSALVHGAVARGLGRVLNDDWELVWGPATSRMVGDRFDSFGMFLVQNRQHPAQHVLAVRGTNPLSLTDWAFGDFNVGTGVEWPFDAAAHVSTSTAHGLVNLLKLVPKKVDVFVADLATKIAVPTWILGLVHTLGAERNVGDWLFARIADVATGKLAKAAAVLQVPTVVGKLLEQQLSIQTAELAWANPVPQGLLTHLSDAARIAPLDLVVTGHSKGGALAPAMALWLAETRQVAAGGWDPGKQSTVRFAAFAGPTPGDEAFAARAVAQVGQGSVRVVNDHDVAPCAWSAAGLGGVAAMYGNRSAPLQSLVAAVIAGLAGKHMDYRHVGPPVTVTGVPDPARSLGEEIVYQHLDAYLVAANVGFDAIDMFVG